MNYFGVIMEETVSMSTDVKEEENSCMNVSEFGKGKKASNSGKQLYFHSDFAFLDSDEEIESKSTKVILLKTANAYYHLNLSQIVSVIVTGID